MKGRLIVAACWTLLACGSTKRADQSGEGGATSGDGSAGAAAGQNAGGETVALSLDVVQSTPGSAWGPAARAHVRIDGSNVSLEMLSDEEGQVEAHVDADSGPWDITVALAGFSVISVLGVTESLSAPIHISGSPGSAPEGRREISGAITGRAWPGSVLELSGPGLSSGPRSVGNYSALLAPRSEGSNLRFLASEWDSYDDDAAPLNAVWVDVPEAVDAPVDIVLPSPARDVALTEHSIELPSTGPVTGAGLAPSSAFVQRFEDGFRYKVGRAKLEATSDENVYASSVEAFTGDLAPDEVRVGLESDRDQPESQQILINLNPSTEESVSIPAAEALESRGETLDELEVGWSAPAYSHAGASIVTWDGGGRWYVYTFAGSDSAMRPWPRLPDGVSREEVGLGTEDFQVNVFAATQLGVPWDWQGHREQRALVVSTRRSPDPPEVEALPPTGPLNAYDGIYSLTDVTLSSSACAEGPSIRDDSFPDYFVVVGLPWYLQVGSCVDVDDCRALANTFWENEWMTTAWYLMSTFPGSSEGASILSREDATDQQCSQQTLETTRASGSVEALRFTIETVEVPSHPPDDVGECTIELARAAADGVDCSALKVYTGAFYESLY